MTAIEGSALELPRFTRWKIPVKLEKQQICSAALHHISCSCIRSLLSVALFGYNFSIVIFCCGYSHLHSLIFRPPGSYDRAVTTIRKHIIPFIGHYYVTDLTAKVIQVELIDALYNKGLSYSSVKKAYDYLSASLNYAVNSGKLNRNPCRLIKLESRQRSPKETRFLDDNEIKAFVEATDARYANGVPKIKVRKLLLLDLNTGLRVGELCALKWTDVDFTKRNLTVCRNVTDTYNYTNATKKRKKVHLVQDSTKSRDRVVPLNKTAFALLQEMYDEAADKTGFIAGGSEPGNINTMIKNYKRVCDIAGIPDPHGFHTLRHTFASRLFRKGVDVKVVSSILGHSDTGFTYNTYIHLIE